MTDMKSGSSVFRPAMVLTAGRAVGFIATFAIPIILVRIFGQAEFGTYKQLFLIFGTLFVIAQMGMGGSLYYFMPQARKRGASYLVNALLVLITSGIVCLALLWWNAGRIAAWLNNPDLAHYIPYIGGFLFIMLIAVVLEIVMIVRKQHRHAFWAFALSSIMQALFLIVPAVIFRSIQALLLGALAFAALRLSITVVYLLRQFPTRPRLEPSCWKAHMTYAMPYALSVLIITVQRNVHLYAVSGKFDAATFAIYSVGCLTVPLVNFLTTSTSSVMMVKMKEQINEGKDAETLELWRDTSRKLLLVFAPIVGILIVTAHALIIVLYTQKYAASIPIFEIWSAAILLTALLTHSIMRVYAQTRFLVILNLIQLGVVVVSIVFLMNRFGLIGAVASTVIAMIVAKIISLWRSKVVMHCTLGRLLPWKDLAFVVGIASVAALPALAARLLLHLPPIAELFLIPALYLTTYLVLLWFYGPLQPGEKRRFVRGAQQLTLRLFGRGIREF